MIIFIFNILIIVNNQELFSLNHPPQTVRMPLNKLVIIDEFPKYGSVLKSKLTYLTHNNFIDHPCRVSNSQLVFHELTSFMLIEEFEVNEFENHFVNGSLEI